MTPAGKMRDLLVEVGRTLRRESTYIQDHLVVELPRRFFEDLAEVLATPAEAATPEAIKQARRETRDFIKMILEIAAKDPNAGLTMAATAAGFAVSIGDLTDDQLERGPAAAAAMAMRLRERGES